MARSARSSSSAAGSPTRSGSSSTTSRPAVRDDRPRRARGPRAAGSCYGRREIPMHGEESDGVPGGPAVLARNTSGPRPRRRVRVGITDFAQDALGDVVYVDLPELGTAGQGGSGVRRGRVHEIGLGRLRPGLRHDVERNAALEDRPELVNEQPYGDGWLVAIEPPPPTSSARSSTSPPIRSTSSRRRRRSHLLDPRPMLQRRSRETRSRGRGLARGSVDPPDVLR